jgi:hypothetical protein
LVLAHVCCGPCAITVLRDLKERGLDPLGFYYNPNIHPLTEYLRRREALEEVSRRLEVSVRYADAEHDPALFLRQVAFRETERCRVCWRLRLTRAALEAKRLGCQGLTTTLLYSKYQDHEAVAAIGQEAAQDQGLSFYYEDYRKTWDEGIAISKQWGLYRQPYCGCVFSEFERYRKRLPG